MLPYKQENKRTNYAKIAIKTLFIITKSNIKQDKSIQDTNNQ